jgi:hypothetical protein
VARNAAALAWRPATRHDWVAALALLDELQGSREEGRDSFYLNEIGVRARADWPEDLMAVFEAEDLDLQGWYGVRTASDNVSVDTPTPPHDELEQLLSVEERLGATDPYRRLSTLFHLVGRASG